MWYDKVGNCGKSWFTGALWERGLAYVTAESKDDAVIKDIASDFLDHGYRPFVIIDLPRTAQWSNELYLAIERIKDGLIKDPRYNSRTVNIRGVKVLVCCNSLPKLDKLSKDRWVRLEADGTPWTGSSAGAQS
ncbi:rep protein [Macaca mulatta feces associated virus 5]|nr:rep protein [Macaca mulatta feces associated virus 5]